MAPRRPKHDDDDFWGGSSDEEAGAAHLEREWRAREANFHSSGYREGLQEGKRETVQAGFNEGFADGAVQGFEWGAARGALSTLHALAGQLPGTSGQIDDVASHHARLGNVTVEHAAQQLIRHRLLNKQAPWQQDDQHAEVPLRPAAAATAAAAEGSGGGGCSRGEACCQSDSTDQQQTGCSRAGDSHATTEPDAWGALHTQGVEARAFVASVGPRVNPKQPDGGAVQPCPAHNQPPDSGVQVE